MKRMVKFLCFITLTVIISFSVIGCNEPKPLSGVISGTISFSNISNPPPIVEIFAYQRINENEWISKSNNIIMSGLSGSPSGSFNWSIPLNESDGFFPGEVEIDISLKPNDAEYARRWWFLKTLNIDKLDFNAGNIGSYNIKTVTLKGTVTGIPSGGINITARRENGNFLGSTWINNIQFDNTWEMAIWAPENGINIKFYIRKFFNGDWFEEEVASYDAVTYNGSSPINNITLNISGNFN